MKLLSLLEYISEAKVLGLPLDFFIHALIALSIFLILLRIYRDTKLAFLFVFYLGIIKELYDLSSQGQNLTAATMDMIANFFLIILYLVFKFWSRTKHR